MRDLRLRAEDIGQPYPHEEIQAWNELATRFLYDKAAFSNAPSNHKFSQLTNQDWLVALDGCLQTMVGPSGVAEVIHKRPEGQSDSTP